MPSKKTSKPMVTQPSFAFTLDNTPDALRKSILNHLKYSLARDTHTASKHDWWWATSLAVRDRVMERFISTQGKQNRSKAKRVYYLSLEYLMGRLMRNNLVNLEVFESAKAALKEMNMDLDDLLDEEVDMGLGNGGLGRLAACFMDSLATLDYPAVGYGIYYEYGLFEQQFRGNRQHERPDNWLKFSNPWVVTRKDHKVEVRLFGRVEWRPNEDDGQERPSWVDAQIIQGVPHDIPIVGYGTDTVNFLRLWESKASQEFNFDVFNSGGYIDAVQEKMQGATITRVLYPNDSSENGKELRLVQQYFFVACSLQDIIRRFRRAGAPWKDFHKHAVMQLNDTHPAVAVAELMRILLDDELMSWDTAWEICQSVFNYTNHTLLPEALEKWPLPLFERVLPRHIQIIYEINRRFLDEVSAKWPNDDSKLGALSIIEEGGCKYIRMAHLAMVAAKSVNGVAALHSDLLKKSLFADFHALWPTKLQNKTNGITPRRWLKACNPKLSNLIDRTIGEGWAKDLDKLTQLAKYAEDKKFQKEFADIKLENKKVLAATILKECGVTVDPAALFDVQIKRLHEYKRQHLNLLHIISLYHKLLDNPDMEMTPRVFVFGAKAAPGYYMAKKIIHAINSVAEVVNRDPRIKGKLKIAFIPNYSVSLAEKIIPAAEISEQISTAGKEASGTGNMKLSLNGALTVGTLDGANVEIRDCVGHENFFLFGMNVDEVQQRRAQGYNPYDFYNSNPELRRAIDALREGEFTPGNPNALTALVNNLLEGGDPYMVLADYESYAKAQNDIDKAYRDQATWQKMSILNTAHMGMFSSDRTIKQYADEIWDVEPLA